MTFVDRIDSADAVTIAEDVSGGVRFTAAEVEIGTVIAIETTCFSAYKTPFLRVENDQKKSLVTLHSGAIPVANSYATVRAIQARRAWIQVQAAAETASISRK